jgi:LuxR family maltose regulon positive regulatory protein
MLTSKITIPLAPPGLVDRPRLRGRLDDAVTRPLVLVSAPAGSGKTTLLTSWVRGGAAGHPVAWLTAEPGDDHDGFWSYLYEAVTRAVEPVSPPPRDTLPAPQPAVDGAYPARLAVALGRIPQPVVLIVDDVQGIVDRRIIDGLHFLLRHVDGALRLVLSTRVDPPLPLRRWQVGGQLAELRADDLAFTPAESSQWLGHELPGLDRPRADVLHSRTEGWPAGLRFAVLALRDADGGGPPDRFGGVHGPLADYLREEVLAEQPQHRVDAMLCTAILDRVCGGLMDALTGRTDGDRILADLERANTFVVPLGGPEIWFRYRRLFGELLLAELVRQSPDRVGALHRRAAGWFAEHRQPVGTLHHALGAQDWSTAVDVLRGHWQELMVCGDTGPHRFVVPLPPDEALRADPELALACAADRLNGSDLSDADICLDTALAGARTLPPRRRDGFALLADAVRLIRAERRGLRAEVRSLAPRVAGRASPAGVRAEAGARAIALTALGAAGPGTAHLDGAEKALAAGRSAATRAGLTCQRAASAAQLAVVRALRGRLRAAEEAAQSCLAAPFCASGCTDRRDGFAHLALAGVRFQQNRPAAARHHVEQVGPLDDATPPAAITLFSLLRAWSLQLHGEPEEAHHALTDGLDHLEAAASAGYLGAWLVAAEADLRTAHGDTRGARALLADIRADVSQAAPLDLALARTLLHEGDATGARTILEGRARDAASRGTVSIGVAGRLLEALAASRTGADGDATRLLEGCLGMAEPEGLRQVFLQDEPGLHELLVRHLDSGTAYWFTVDELVRNTHRADRHAPPPAALVVPLTERELSVLRYLPSALSNADIAGELSVSVHTVKTHLRNIFRKLDVSRRREAVLRARGLKLL